MTRSSLHSTTITFLVWSIAASVVSVAAWISPICDNNVGPLPSCTCRQEISSTTLLRVLSQDVSESLEKSETAAEGGASKIPYVIARGDGSIGGGGLPMPQSYVPPTKSEEDGDENNDETEELRRPKVNAEMPQG